jgi:hypothetical protein
MANTSTGLQRRGGVRKGKSWTLEALRCYRAALVLRRRMGPWARPARRLMAEALRIISAHSRSLKLRCEALDLLARVDPDKLP